MGAEEEGNNFVIQLSPKPRYYKMHRTGLFYSATASANQLANVTVQTDSEPPAVLPYRKSGEIRSSF